MCRDKNSDSAILSVFRDEQKSWPISRDVRGNHITQPRGVSPRRSDVINDICSTRYPFCACDRYRAKGKVPKFSAFCGRPSDLLSMDFKRELYKILKKKCDVAEEILFCIFRDIYKGACKGIGINTVRL